MSSENETYSRENALEVPTFQRLFLGALEIEDDEERLRTGLIILCAGRLGLRVSEIQHLHEGWIDWRRGTIRVPDHDPCFCTWCLDSARGKVATERDVSESELDSSDDAVQEYAYEHQFEPKTDSSARVIPFGWSGRITAWLLRFFDEKQYIDLSQQHIRNSVRKAARNADGVNPENVTPHPLRATAATFFADAGLSSKPLRDLLGHSDRTEARRYVRNSGRQLTHRIHERFDRAESAPDPIPDDPSEQFPVACHPQPFASETGVNPEKGVLKKRLERAEARDDEETRIFNPRRKRCPDDIEYDDDDFAIPGHVDPSGEGLESPNAERKDEEWQSELDMFPGRNEDEQGDPETAPRRKTIGGSSSAVIPGLGTLVSTGTMVVERTWERAKREKAAIQRDPQRVWPTPKRAATAIGLLMLFGALIGLNLASQGYAPSSLADLANAPPALIAGFLLAILVVIWRFRDLGEPPQ